MLKPKAFVLEKSNIDETNVLAMAFEMKRFHRFMNLDPRSDNRRVKLIFDCATLHNTFCLKKYDVVKYIETQENQD